jgi:hypothetical protein
MTRLSFRAGRLMWRWAARGAAAAGLVGGVVGLVVGLRVHPPTAWFAIFELGLPAAIVGGLVGLASGAVAYAVNSKA